MRRRWRDGSSLLTLFVLVVATTANDSSLFECPKGSYRFTPLTDRSFPKRGTGLGRAEQNNPSAQSPVSSSISLQDPLRCIKLSEELSSCVDGAVKLSSFDVYMKAYKEKVPTEASR